MKKMLIALAVMAISPALAQADVTLNMSLGQFLGFDGSTPLSPNSTLAIFADTGSNGFGDFTLASDSWAVDPDDVLLALFPTNDFLGAGTSFDPVVFGFDGLTAGDELLLAWYDLDFSASLTGPGNGTYFGTFRTDDAIDGSDIGWVVPNDGATVNLNFVTDALGGSNSAQAGIAQFQTQVIPEPISVVLGVIGGGAMIARRRFNRKQA
jgi:hypothetical protein